MYYVLDDGRILSDFNDVGESKYVAVNEYPNPIISGDKIKVCTGIEGNVLKWEMFDYEEPKEPEPEPTQLDKIEETQLMMMEAMADQYEQGLEQDLINMEVQATIYEAVMALGGGEV